MLGVEELWSHKRSWWQDLLSKGNYDERVRVSVKCETSCVTWPGLREVDHEGPLKLASNEWGEP